MTTTEAEAVEETEAQELSLVEKFLAVERDLNTVVLDRHEPIHSMMLALVAGQHVFLLGPPGTAKSYMVDQLVKRIDAKLFKWLLTMFSNDNELFGGPDVSSLRAGTYRRVTEGKMPWAEIVFLDEIFKASDSILNALLKIINEREFDNAGDDPRVPLISLFCASNEFPQNSDLEALVDRLTLRHVVHDLRDPDLFVQMLSMGEAPPQATMTIDDIKDAQDEAQQVEVGEHIHRVILELREKLEGEGIKVSDRRFRQSIDIIKAQAWLAGRTIAEVVDTVPLMHMFWRDPEQYQTIRRIILDLADPLERDVTALEEELNKAYSEFERAKADAVNENDLAAVSLETYNYFREAKKEFRKLKAKADESGRTSPALEKLRNRLREIGPKILREGMNVEGDDDMEDKIEKRGFGS